MGRFVDVEKFLEEGRHLGDPQASTKLGDLYVHQGRFVDAEKFLEEGRQFLELSGRCN